MAKGGIKTMDYQIIRGGELEQARVIQSGDPILHSQHDWWRQYFIYYNSGIIIYFFFMVGVITIINLVFLVIIGIPVDSELIIYLSLVIILMSPVLNIYNYYFYRTRGIVPGLYEYGIMLPRTKLFVPYEEIDPRILFKDHLLSRSLFIQVKNDKDGHLSWNLPSMVFGHKGFMAIIEKVYEMNRTTSDKTKLRLYT